MREEKTTVSIIIPVHNREATISATVSSAYTLKGPELEVIVVNDGSTDQTALALERLLASHPDLRLIHQQHLGVSAARNRGIEEASGHYILFLDAGDQLLAQDLTPLMSGADMHAFSVTEAGLDGAITEHRESQFRGTGLAYYRARMGAGRFHAAIWKYMFSKSFLRENSLFFKRGIVHEDMLFCMQTLAAARLVHSSDILLYNYIRAGDSITTTMSAKHMDHRLASLAVVVEELGRLQALHPGAGIDRFQIRCLRYANTLALQTNSKRRWPGIAKRRSKTGMLRLAALIRRWRNPGDGKSYSQQQKKLDKA